MASRLSLSRLRLSSYWGPLSRFHASDKPPKLKLEVDDAVACDEVSQICKHLDLECEVLTAPAQGNRGLRHITIRRGAGDFPEDDTGGDEQPAAADEVAQAVLPPGGSGGAPATGAAAPAPAPARKRPRQVRAVMEAEQMLSVAPPGLSKFYEELMDAFPGHQVKLAKLMVDTLRAAGYAGPASSDSSSSSLSSSSSGKKKKNKQKKEKKKKKKDKRKRLKKEKAKLEHDDSAVAKLESAAGDIKAEEAKLERSDTEA